ncbi:hypothetical protein DFH27DRAFT_639402 [Peziza echinospora]|nr:hypothetical protein DFH27DRAFT_639402 [Peziza echinospora]
MHQAILAGQRKTNVKGKRVSKTSWSTNIGNQSTIQYFFSRKLKEQAKEWSEVGVEQQAIMAHKLMFKKFLEEQERFKSYRQKRLVELMFLELEWKSWKGKPKLVMIPTGEGKSLLYCLPFFYPEALVNDQIMRLKGVELKINGKVAFQGRMGSRPQSKVVVLSYDSLRKDLFLDWLTEKADADHISKIVVNRYHVFLSEWVLIIGEKLLEGFRPCMAEIEMLSKLLCTLLFLMAMMPPHWNKSWAYTVGLKIERLDIHRSLTYRTNIIHDVQHNTPKGHKERGWKRSVVWLGESVEGEERLKGNEHGLVFFGSKRLLEYAAVAVEELGLVIFRHYSDITESGRGGRLSGSAVATLVFEGTLELESSNEALEEATIYVVDGDEIEGMDQAYMWRYFLRASKCMRELLGYLLDGMPRLCEGIPNGELCDCCKRRGAMVNGMEAGKARDARETLKEIFRAKAVLVKFESMKARTGVSEEVDIPEVELVVDGEFEEVGDGLEGGDSAEEVYREDLTQVMVEELGNRGVQCVRGQEERADDSWIQNNWNSRLELLTQKIEEEIHFEQRDGEKGKDGGEEKADKEEYGSEVWGGDWEIAMLELEREESVNDGPRDITSSSILPTSAEQMLVYREVNRWSKKGKDAEEEEEEREGCRGMIRRRAEVTHSQLLDIFNTTMQSGPEKGVEEGIWGWIT